MSGGLRWRPQTSVYATGGASRNPRTQSYRWHPSLPGKRRRIGVDVVEADEREDRVRGMDRRRVERRQGRYVGVMKERTQGNREVIMLR